MSRGINYLHSHSGLERDLKETVQDKFHVLVDEKFKHIFDECGVETIPFTYNHVHYYKVPTYAFFRKGGVFKNLNS